MKISTLVKYIDFSLEDKIKDVNVIYPGEPLALEKWGKYTYMIGNQTDDRYCVDNVGGPLGIDYNNLKLIIREGCDVFETTIKLLNKEFTIFIENDCGFAVAYGPPEIFELIMKNK